MSQDQGPQGQKTWARGPASLCCPLQQSPSQEASSRPEEGRSYSPLRRQLVQPATDDGRSFLRRGSVAGVRRNGSVLVRLRQAPGGQGHPLGGGAALSNAAVALRVSGGTRPSRTSCPGGRLTPERRQRPQAHASSRKGGAGLAQPRLYEWKRGRSLSLRAG